MSHSQRNTYSLAHEKLTPHIAYLEDEGNARLSSFVVALKNIQKLPRITEIFMYNYVFCTL